MSKCCRLLSNSGYSLVCELGRTQRLVCRKAGFCRRWVFVFVHYLVTVAVLGMAPLGKELNS